MTLSSRPGNVRIERGVPLAGVSSLAIGGPARYFVSIDRHGELDELWSWASSQALPVLFVGHGSNILFPDSGFPGLVVRNSFFGIEQSGLEVRVAGAEPLTDLIRFLNRNQLAGLEKMYGIPGTVAGAVVGNAGAYGQEIRDSVQQVRVWSPEGVRVLHPGDLRFGYRHSRFKEEPELFVTDVSLRLRRSDERLQEVSDAILEKRLQKYPEGLRCPGSYFKNVLVDSLPSNVRLRVPPEYVEKGKIPAGRLLEAVGARGARRGEAGIADYHGNLFVNYGKATARDIVWLANFFATRVEQEFGIILEPEVLVVPERLDTKQ